MTLPDLRKLCARMADELDHYRQLLMDDRRETHALAAEARTLLAQPEPPTDGEVAELVAALRDDAECVEAEQHDLCNMTAQQMRRAADLLERLAQPESQGPNETAWALAQLLDGVQRHDLPNMTGLSDSDCDRIWAARPATTEDPQ